MMSTGWSRGRSPANDVRHAALFAQRPEARADLFREESRLLPGREMAAPVEPVVVDPARWTVRTSWPGDVRGADGVPAHERVLADTGQPCHRRQRDLNAYFNTMRGL
jgi:hypothetical protein